MKLDAISAGIKSIVFQVFPLSPSIAVNDYVDKEIRHPALVQNATLLVNAITAAADADVISAIHGTALSRVEEEDKRQNSVTARAQSLLVGLSFFGFILTVAASVISSPTYQGTVFGWIAVGLAIYIVSQIAIMGWNVVYAIQGAQIPRTGSSDLAAWLSLGNADVFKKKQAVDFLDHYRRISLTNTWRFNKLYAALAGFRNIVIAMSILAACLLILSIISPVKKDILLMILS